GTSSPAIRSLPSLGSGITQRLDCGRLAPFRESERIRLYRLSCSLPEGSGSCLSAAPGRGRRSNDQRLHASAAQQALGGCHDSLLEASCGRSDPGDLEDSTRKEARHTLAERRKRTS